MDGQQPIAESKDAAPAVVDETAAFEVSTDDTPIFSIPKEEESDAAPQGSEDKNPQEAPQESDQEKAQSAKDKKFDELVADRERQRLKIEELESTLKNNVSKKDEKSTQDLIDNLDPSDFDDYSDYLDKREELEAQLKNQDKGKEKQQSTAKADKNDQPKVPELTENQRVAREILREKIGVADNLPQDFKEVVESNDVFITPEMLEALAVCKDPVSVMYALGKNKEQTNKIAHGSVFEQARYINELEFAGTKPAPKKPPQITGAPDPISPVSGAGDPAQKKLSDMSFAEYERLRNSEKQTGSGWS